MFGMIRFAAVCAVLLGAASPVAAADLPGQTMIVVKGMHCAGCAKAVTKRLQSVADVTTAAVDAEKGSATVLAADGRTVSPRALWESVEKAGYTPVELKGPSGVFTAKPEK